MIKEERRYEDKLDHMCLLALVSCIAFSLTKNVPLKKEGMMIDADIHNGIYISV